MNLPFFFCAGELDSPLYHRLRFAWTMVQHEADTTGLDLRLQVTRSKDYDPRHLPRYDPETRILDVDGVSGVWVALAQLVEGLSLHETRDHFQGDDVASVSRWHAAAAAYADRFRGQMDAFAAALAGEDKPTPRKARRSQTTTGVGKGNWERPDVHPLHCQALKSNWKPCQAMRRKGTAFCHLHQDWHSTLESLDHILRDLEDSGWREAVAGRQGSDGDDTARSAR